MVQTHLAVAVVKAELLADLEVELETEQTLLVLLALEEVQKIMEAALEEPTTIVELEAEVRLELVEIVEVTPLGVMVELEHPTL